MIAVTELCVLLTLGAPGPWARDESFLLGAGSDGSAFEQIVSPQTNMGSYSRKADGSIELVPGPGETVATVHAFDTAALQVRMDLIIGAVSFVQQECKVAQEPPPKEGTIKFKVKP